MGRHGWSLESDDEAASLQLGAAANEGKHCRAGWVAAVGCALGGLALVTLGAWHLGTRVEGSNHLEDWQEKQELQQEQTSQGGTLEPGPGCPSACGSFVACSLKVSSPNNLLPLEIAENQGFFPLNAQNTIILSLQRLFNKQITPFVPEFQCPDSDCWIPLAFVGDDFCDCPVTCADEAGHSCESCGVEFTALAQDGASCPSVCGSLNENSITCLGAGTGELFQCPDTLCQISSSFLNDNRCDCPGTCADEDFWDCGNCSCPTICGVAVFACDETGVFDCPVTTMNQSCNLPGAKQNDGICDCPETCADEAGSVPPLDCDFCRCPLACGQDIKPLGDCIEEDGYLNFPEFLCPGGCPIPEFWTDDGICDCPGTCDDEPSFDCTTCGCPDNCGGYAADCEEVTFKCPDSNCTIPGVYVNDNYCDCPGTCADEEFWTCETCTFGCAAFCGSSFACDLRVFQCSSSDCELTGTQVNDNRCDCPDCEDEEFWTCDTCSRGCPSECLDFIPEPCALAPGYTLQCPGQPFGTCEISSTQYFDNVCDCFPDCLDEDFFCQDVCASEELAIQVANIEDFCPASCDSAPSRSCSFRCPGGDGEEDCVLEGIKVNDGQCDCPETCADEDFWDCNNCSCSSTCDPFIINQNLKCADQFRCPDGCIIDKAWVEDGICDCPGDCADETQWSCDNCSCVDGCGQPKVQVQCSEQFSCPDGCIINVNQLDDLTCNCPNCEDESDPAIDCIQCFGLCPSSCGETPSACKYRCQDGCLIPAGYVNDIFCDCPNTCDDEQDFTCFGQPGGNCQCATECGEFFECTPPSTPAPPPPPPPPPPPGSFICTDGCPIPQSYLDDDYCDCPDCGDEPRWTCENCTCPACGNFFFCELPLSGAESSPPVNLAQPLSQAEALVQVAEPREALSTHSSAKVELGGRYVAETTIEAAFAIRSAMRRANQGRGTGKPEERLRRELESAFGEGNGGENTDTLSILRIFSGGLRHQVLHTALLGALGYLGSDDEMRRQCHAIFVDGPALPDARKVEPSKGLNAGIPKEVGARGRISKKSKESKKKRFKELKEKQIKSTSTKEGRERTAVDAAQFILEEMIRLAYADKSQTFPEVLAKTLRNERRDKTPPASESSRELQGRPDIPSAIIPEDAFLCPDVADCPLPRYFVNNRKCDCPVTCADEDAFDCNTCVPKVPFGFQGETTNDAALGVSVGVSLGIGIGIGLGVGLGLTSALAAFFAAGVVQFSVANAEEFINDPAVQQGMKKAFARLAGLEGSLDAVKLNWACAAGAISTLTSRRLGEEVKLCFEIESEGEEESLDMCQVLTNVDPQGAQEVMHQELEAAGADTDFELISWEPEPNPKSYNPTAILPEKADSNKKSLPTFLQPSGPSGFFGKQQDAGIDFG